MPSEARRAQVLIEAVTFDLWNTLITNRDFTELRVDHLAGVLEELGASRSHWEIRDAYLSARAHARTSEESEEHRCITTMEKIDHGLVKLGVELPEHVKSTIVDRFEEAIWQDPPTLKEGVAETLKALSPQYKMAIVSDSGITPGRVIRQVLRELEILDFFASTVFSDEVGFCKPNRVMFEKALGELGAGPRKAIHVGDLLHTDIAGAKAMGMKAVWVREEETTVKYPWKPDYEITILSQLPPVLEEISRG